ncbi:LysR family transcriptional regulator [Sphingobium yanoikuyae]|uniref:LysR family transcriptional regulator n=1 Tax=Sphingobium yanoikuyae TaxID=13690 RepID=UPI0028AF2960|nr:LysR family transcriptional regulator [Sphingobium yanoikuyae]
MNKIYDDLAAFVAVARAESFTGAARQMGVSQSALSQTIRNLEARLQMRLLSRTTRHVKPTELGEKVLEAAEQRLADLSEDLNRLQGMSDRPAGTIRISASPQPTEAILWPKLAPLLAANPDLHIEIDSNAALVDIVSDRFDAGVRLGEQVEKDMITVPIGPMERMIVVAAPEYLKRFGTPRHPRDLTDHDCIQIRMPTARAPIPWEFQKNAQEINVRVSGRIICNNKFMQIDAAARGLGLTWLLEEPNVKERIAAGDLVTILDEWCEPFPGFHLYYPSRRQHSHAFRLVIDALRWRGD